MKEHSYDGYYDMGELPYDDFYPDFTAQDLSYDKSLNRICRAKREIEIPMSHLFITTSTGARQCLFGPKERWNAKKKAAIAVLVYAKHEERIFKWPYEEPEFLSGTPEQYEQRKADHLKWQKEDYLKWQGGSLR